MNNTTRINKYLAEQGYASRRRADELVEQGLVFINGKKAVPGDKVSTGDKVEVRGMQAKEFEYFAYYKPQGIVTIGAQEGEKEIKDVTDLTSDIFPLGRLDKDSEGLIIMTNDGRITEALLSPTSKHEKEYTVTVDKPVSHILLVRLSQGVQIGKAGQTKNYKTKKTEVRKTTKDSFDIILREGKNRQIRRMCGAVGFQVRKLKRFRIMNITLGKLKPNTYRKLKGKELEEFLKALGK
jgi:23S rRNA pseudouridine2604 synthase